MVLTWLLAMGMAPVSKHKFEEVFPVSVLLITMVTYICTAAGVKSAAFWVVALLTAALFVVAVLVCRRDKIQAKTVASWIFSEGFFVLLAVTAVVILCFSKARVLYADDTNYWGTFVKQMYWRESFPNSRESCSGFSDYSPAMQMLGCFFQISKANFTDNVLFYAHFTMVYALLTPLLQLFQFKKRAWYKTLLVTFPLYLILPTFFAKQVVIGLAADTKGGLLFGYIIYLICSTRKKDGFFYFCLGLALSVLGITKSPLVLMMIVALLFFWARLLQEKTIRNRKFHIGMGVLVTAVPLAVWYSWRVLCQINENASYLHLHAQSALMAAESRQLALPDYAGPVLVKYLKALLLLPLNGAPAFLGLSVAAVVAVFVVVCVLGQRKMLHKRRTVIDAALLLGFLFAFCAGHYFTYILVMAQDEAEKLSSFARYLGMYTPAFFYWIACYAKQWWNERSRQPSDKRKLLAVLLALYLLLNNIIGFVGNFVPALRNWNYTEQVTYNLEAEQATARWLPFVGEDVDHILLIIDQGQMGRYPPLFYSIVPIPVFWWGQYDEAQNPQEYLNSIEGLCREKNCNYLYIADYCTQRSTPLSQWLGAEVKTGALYKIDFAESGASLEELYVPET